MNVLQISRSSLAGVAALMARTILQYTAAPARAICESMKHHSWYLQSGIEVPFLDSLSSAEAQSWLEWADVIHCHANVSARVLGRVDLLTRKRWVFQWHGAQVIPWHMLFRPGDERHYLFLHIGQGWWNQSRQAEFFRAKGAVLAPNVITIEDEVHRPMPWAEREPRRVAFSPSNVRNGVNTKGAEETRKALKAFDLDMIVHRPFDEAMRRKAKAYLGIDEVVTPVYHRSGLEFCSLGVPCLESWGTEAEDQLKLMTGASQVPFLPATIENLRAIVKRLLLDADALRKAGMDARKWMETYYHPRDLIRRYMTLYGGSE